MNPAHYYYYNSDTQVLTVDGVSAADVSRIKASADMLAALRPVAELYEYEQIRGLFPRGQTWDTIPHNIGQAARAAIARAEGSK